MRLKFLSFSGSLPCVAQRWRDRGILLAVLTAGSVLTLLAGISVQQAEELRRHEQKTEVTQAVASAFTREVTRTTEALRGAGFMLESNPQLTHDQFNRYMEKMVGTQLKINLVEWQPIVPADRLEQFEAMARAMGLPAYRVVQPDASGKGWEPVSGRAEYVPVLLAWPEHYRTEGLDMSFSPQRMESKLQSRTFGEPVASGTFQFMKEGMVNSGITAMAISTTVFDTDQSARGYLAAVIDLSTLFMETARIADAAKFDLLVFESSTPEAAPVYIWHGEGSDLKQGSAGPNLFKATDQTALVEVAHKSWKLVLHPRPAFYASLLWSGSGLTFATGLGMTLLALGAVYRMQKIGVKLQRSLDFKEQILENSPIGIAIFDENGQCIVANTSIANIVGARIDQLLDLNYHHIETWRKNGLYQTAIQSIKEGSVKGIELTAKSTFGKDLNLDCSFCAFTSDNITYLLLMTTDVTQRVEARNELLAAKLEAETANLAKSEFLSNMSHEIRTPMNAILGMNRLALKTDLDADQRHYLTIVQQSAEGLLRLIDDILDFSKIEAGQLALHEHPFLLEQVLKGIEQTFGQSVQGKGLSFSLEWIGDACPSLVGDDFRLRQILINLINNAIKFTEHGNISVRAEVVSQTEDKVTLQCSVADTGLGIPKDFLASLFDRFSQADTSISRKYGGSGLGLAICKKLIELLGGKIWVESELGKGSIFHFTICFKKDREERSISSAESEAQRLQALPESPLKILLVEDNQANRELAKIVLEMEGHRVTQACNGVEALEILSLEDFNAALMDVQMPVMDGIEATLLIRQCEHVATIDQAAPHKELLQRLTERIKGSHLPIIAMTANAMSGDREKCIEAGMDDYVTKPFEPDEVFAVLRRVTSSTKSDENYPGKQPI